MASRTSCSEASCPDTLQRVVFEVRGAAFDRSHRPHCEKPHDLVIYDNNAVDSHFGDCRDACSDMNLSNSS